MNHPHDLQSPIPALWCTSILRSDLSTSYLNYLHFNNYVYVPAPILYPGTQEPGSLTMCLQVPKSMEA